MIIATSNLHMQSSRTYESFSSASLYLTTDRAKDTNREQALGEQELSYSSHSREQDSENSSQNTVISSFSKEQEKTHISTFTIPQVDLKEEAKSLESIRQQCLVYLWACLFGEERAISLAEKYGLQKPQNFNKTQSHQPFEKNEKANASLPMEGQKPQTTITSPLGTQILVTGERSQALTMVREKFFTEKESTSFSTKGTVVTADGRELSFNLELSMSRSFTLQGYEKVSSAANFIDPLVINLNGNIAQVSDQKFFFDLNEDGIEDELPKLSSDSGYLALDFNNDGKINDGGELFGTRTGNGFIDLAKYDGDQNGWIDEQDPVWEKLKIWVQKDDGSDELLTLKESGVGAICLQNSVTEFSQRNSLGQIDAAIRRTGIFLYENGLAGTIQHLDLAQNSSALYA